MTQDSTLDILKGGEVWVQENRKMAGIKRFTKKMVFLKLGPPNYPFET